MEYVIYEVKRLEILISKKMFLISKHEKVLNPPSPLQFKILNYLFNNKGLEVKQSDLEKSLKVSRATISEVLNTMEKTNLIKRASSIKDARCKIITLTKESKKRFLEMNIISKKINEILIKNLKPNEIKTFLKILEKMQNNLNEIESDD